MDLFAVKWTSLVLHALHHWPGGKCRTGDLQRALPGISKKMLIQTLREVEHRGLVHRRVYNVVPPKVEYELTPLGRTFAQPIEMLYQWGEANQPALDQMEQHANSSRDAPTE
jgi:DNA-binding HxlR family transcriptional regulator